MRLALLALALVLMAASAEAFDDPGGFRGISWGASQVDVAVRLKELDADRSRCHPTPQELQNHANSLASYEQLRRVIRGPMYVSPPTPSYDTGVCTGFLHLNGVLVELRYWVPERGGFQSVAANPPPSPSAYPNLLRVLVERYGPPTQLREVELVVTHTGAKVTSHVAEWVGPQTSILLKEHDGSLRVGRFLISKSVPIEQVEAAEKARLQRGVDALR
jgi:hypothetical protein